MNEMRFTRRSATSTHPLVAAAQWCCHIKPRPSQRHGRDLCQVAASAGDEQQTPARTLRWGIAPVNLMAEDFATALSVLPAELHCINSCMAAYRSQALSFADKHRVPNVYTSFEDLARCPDVDAVYISPLNPMHCELCHLMLNHDKHVLCEQPMCMAERQVVDLVSKANARGLFLMEGFWPRCIPAYHLLRREIIKLGKIQQVDCCLGGQMPSSLAKLTPYAGVTKDLGPYGIQLALWVYQEVPQRLRVAGKADSEGIDVVANIELIFKDHRCARIFLSAEREMGNTATIHGKRGSVTLNNLFSPTLITFKNTKFEFKLPNAEQTTHNKNRIGLCYQAEEMRKCILNGRNESDLFTHSESRLMANLTNQIKEMVIAGCEDTELQENQAIC